MKHYTLLISTLLIILLSSNLVIAQDVIRNKDCSSLDIKKQADSLKFEMAKSGYVVLRETSMSMESEYEMPVIVPLNEGVWYHVAFIGDGSSRLLELRMFDWEEKQVIYKKSKNDNILDTDGSNSNILNYTYAPKFSEYHMIKPLQVNKKKKKEVCGYIILFKKVK
jgi:hypothetical protein